MASATIMDRYYDLLSLSAIGQQEKSVFKISTFKFGYDFVDESGDEPIVLAVPSTTETISSIFYSDTPQLSYSNGRILIRCEMPKGSIQSGTTAHYSCCGVYDADDNLLFVMAGQPAWLDQDDLHVVETYIDNVLAGA